MLDLRISQLGNIITATVFENPSTHIGTYVFDNYQAVVADTTEKYRRLGYYSMVLKCVRIFATRSIRSSPTALMSDGARGAWNKSGATLVVCSDYNSFYELR